MFGAYKGQDFLGLELKGSKPIIEGLLWQRDNTILLGKEKVGKSIFSQVMAMHLTAGEPLFGEYNIPKACNVVYLQSEGKIAQTQSNLKEMTKVIPANLERFLLLFYPAIGLDTDEGYQEVHKQISEWDRPPAQDTVFIGDSLYMMMQGDLLDARDAKNMVHRIRQLAEDFQMTNVFNHHAHRPNRKPNGEIIDEGDDSIFGSFVWKAYPDNVLMLSKVRDKHLRLSCATQRTGSVVESTDLVMVQPSPLYLEIKGDSRPSVEQLAAALTDDWQPIRDLSYKTGYVKSTVWSGLNKLKMERRAESKVDGIESLWKRTVRQSEILRHA